MRLPLSLSCPWHTPSYCTPFSRRFLLNYGTADGAILLLGDVAYSVLALHLFPFCVSRKKYVHPYLYDKESSLLINEPFQIRKVHWSKRRCTNGSGLNYFPSAGYEVKKLFHRKTEILLTLYRVYSRRLSRSYEGFLIKFTEISLWTISIYIFYTHFGILVSHML